MHPLVELIDAVPHGGAFTVDDAVLVAAVAHHSQRDRGRPSQPYLAHPMRLVAAFEMCSVCKPSRTMKATQATLNVQPSKRQSTSLRPGGRSGRRSSPSIRS